MAAGPPLDIHLEIASGPDGPRLSTGTFDLVTGEYYRLNVTSDGDEPWRLEIDDLLRSSHLRIVTINGIEVHLQAQTFRAIECGGPRSLRRARAGVSGPCRVAVVRERRRDNRVRKPRVLC